MFNLTLIVARDKLLLFLVLLPGRLSCDNAGGLEVDDRYIVALIMKRPNFHQVSEKDKRRETL
jgi:hypothetical protein